MAHRAPWDYEEAAIAKGMLDAGHSPESVARHLDRTTVGISKAMFRYYGPQRCEAVDRYTVGPAIGLTVECKRLRNDALWGSDALANATNALLARMSAALRHECLGADRQSVPGTERVYKTASIERIAA